VSRGTWVSIPGSLIVFAYRAVTFCGRTFQTVRLTSRFLTSRLPCEGIQIDPVTPAAQRSHAWHAAGLGCSRFARRYSGNRGCFLFLEVLRWFTSLRSLLPSYEFRRG
jgi:hypothetical protein